MRLTNTKNIMRASYILIKNSSIEIYIRESEVRSERN